MHVDLNNSYMICTNTNIICLYNLYIYKEPKYNATFSSPVFWGSLASLQKVHVNSTCASNSSADKSCGSGSMALHPIEKLEKSERILGFKMLGFFFQKKKVYTKASNY